MLNVKQFTNKYNWEGIKHLSKKEDWKRFQQNNPTIAFNVVHIKKMEICPAFISKINSNNKNQVTLLMI